VDIRVLLVSAKISQRVGENAYIVAVESIVMLLSLGFGVPGGLDTLLDRLLSIALCALTYEIQMDRPTILPRLSQSV
jgi:hypothetical protein